MPLEPAGLSVVIAARQFNPSVFSQLWLIDNGILQPDGFLPGCLYSEHVVNVAASDFSLVVLPPQLQLVPNCGNEQRLIERVAGGIVRALPHTPYQGVGLNFQWLVWSDERPTNTAARQLFFSNDRRIYRFFVPDDASFGAYLSKDVLGCRLKLDIKPTTIEQGGEKKDRILFMFNFHLDVPAQGGVVAIEQHLQIWDAAKAMATEIVHDVGEL